MKYNGAIRTLDTMPEPSVFELDYYHLESPGPLVRFEYVDLVDYQHESDYRTELEDGTPTHEYDY